MQSETGKLNTEDEVLESEDDMSLESFLLPTNSKMMYSLQDSRLHLSGEAFEKLHIGNHNDSWENNTQDCSMPDDNFSVTL